MHESASLTHGTCTYPPADLASSISRRAHELRRLGLESTSTVILHLPLNDHYVIALLAVTRIGCCVVPVDPSASDRVLDQIVLAVSADAVVTESGIEMMGRAAGHHGPSSPLADDTAFILFTSGTSGTPKGVRGTRRGLANRVRWGSHTYFSGEIERCAIRTNPAFVDSLTEILTAYQAGRHLVVVSQHAQIDLGRLCGFVHDENIEQLTLTPSCIPVLGDIAQQRLQGVKRWVFSGEELRWSWLATIRELSPKAEVINSYGSTEVCGDATVFTLKPGDPVPNIVPIGAPADGVKVAIAASGEMSIGGHQVAAGYLTDQITDDDGNPFSTTSDGIRWFRTGDLVRECGGLLYFEGRSGTTQKVRGRRVDLTGVANALEALEGVDQAHAWVSHGDDGVGALRAAVVATSGHLLTPSSLLIDVAQQVIPQLVPDRIDVVEKFKRNAHGKIDMRPTHSLPAPPRSRFTTGMQHAIACVVTELVTDAEVWPDTAFGEIGLDSLRAVQAAGELSRLFGCDMSGLDVLAAVTIRNLAELVPGFQESQANRAVRVVRDSGATQTLFLLHPAIGTCLGYFALLKYISYPGRIVFVEQDADARAVLESEGMDALAAHYARLSAHYASGPVAVAGYSFGALIAPAVARGLRELGMNVTATALIDPVVAGPQPDPTVDWALRRLLTDAGYDALLPSDPLDLTLAMSVVTDVPGPLSAVPSSRLRHWADCLRTNIISCADYEPAASFGATLVVRATSRLHDTYTNSRWLKRVQNTARTVDIDCSHFELLQGERVVVLARALSDFLTEAPAR